MHKVDFLDIDLDKVCNEDRSHHYVDDKYAPVLALDSRQELVLAVLKLLIAVISLAFEVLRLLIFLLLALLLFFLLIGVALAPVALSA